MAASIAALSASMSALNCSSISPEFKLAISIICLIILVIGLVSLFIYEPLLLPKFERKPKPPKEPKIDKKAWKKYLKTAEKLSKKQ